MNQSCPLCGAPATYEVFHEPWCKHFNCPTCVEFCIDDHAEGYLRGVAQQFRGELSRKAQAAGPGRMFVMRAPSTAELRDQPPKVMVTETIRMG